MIAKLRLLCALLREPDIIIPTTPTILMNSKSTLSMVLNPVIEAKTRHIEIDYHYVHGFVAPLDIHIQFIPFGDQNSVGL